MIGLSGKAFAIDASAWFHDPVLRGHLSPRHWRRLQPRLAEAARALWQACRPHVVSATWFVPGELAAVAPELLRELVGAGHEVALAVGAAAPLALLPAGERERTLAAWSRALRAVEAATGVAVHGCRSAWEQDADEPAWQRWRRAESLVYDGTRLTPDAALFAAWRCDTGAQRLVGLPAAVFASHYDRIADGAVALQKLTVTHRLSMAVTLAIAPMPALRRAPVADEPPATPQPQAPRFAIVVPLKDEESGIESLALELAALARDLAATAACEFVFVDDGSRDRTWALLQQHFAGRAGCTLVQHPSNLGVAAAIRTGLRATDAPLCASIDGDLSYDPTELRAMLQLLQTERADVVTASPYHPRGGVKNVPSWRLFLSRTLSAAYRMLLRSRLHTWTACFRVYRRDAVADLPQSHPGFLGTAELLVRVLRRGGRVVEHPCVLEARLFGFSKMKVLRTVRQHLGLLWQVLWHRIR